MIVQPRGSHVRLYTQHDHGLLSGELAAAWRDPETGAQLDATLILAIALHDLAWRELDHTMQQPDKEGIPTDFLHWPEADKLRVYENGIEQLAEIHPWAGLLLSRHYSSFVIEADEPQFHQRQHLLQQRLRDEAAARGYNVGAEDADFELLRFLDVLSLIVCICEPGSDPESHPVWLQSNVVEERFGYQVSWSGNDVIVDPFPFTEPTRVSIPWVEIPVSASARNEDAQTRGLLTVQFRPV